MNGRDDPRNAETTPPDRDQTPSPAATDDSLSGSLVERQSTDLTQLHPRLIPFAVGPVSRRSLIRGSGILVAGGVTAAGAACGPLGIGEEASTPTPNPPPVREKYPGIPGAPDTPPTGERLLSLSEHEAATVDALIARILPGSEDDPGAREAGVLIYIDSLLAFEEGFPESVYLAGPFAASYVGDEPPTNGTPEVSTPVPLDEVLTDPDTIWIPAEHIERYGYQSPLTHLDAYQQGIVALDEHTQGTYGADAADLDAEQLNELIDDMVHDRIETFERFLPSALFQTLRRHIAQGMFADPAYGGNRDMAGWRLIGYPGAQRAYSPREMQTEDPPRPPQSLHELPVFNPSSPEDHDGVIHPVRGSEE